MERLYIYTINIFFNKRIFFNFWEFKNKLKKIIGEIKYFLLSKIFVYINKLNLMKNKLFTRKVRVFGTMNFFENLWKNNIMIKPV